ncbi:pyridoxamine 5'-phosphate oxidase family protein [Furfurilactobacillus rossiae]|uniref:pyridoxamine 5'-phosphate oxidase family protein n=1 Tax=Furfurilactobacillus rossiae TaxID=231049 RepID=UPI00035C2279|nr:pyridoxamine 5'-phosphate oxidase family protein [Furfurilactobacillus rossiae]QFR66099.1 pyridoxamine 5'-phosphate oxidase family protein [Furfurilactobacillus rossiae]QLE61527.1 pyridoxamine 5-phosphate oxidase [Furfurilactobacillus rossiae]
MLKTIKVAEKMLESATVFQVSTIDSLGFPNITALTPLKMDRSLDTIFFYTKHNSATVKNLSNTTNAAIYCFNEDTHTSLMLKGRFLIVNPQELDSSWTDYLNGFQKSLNYIDPAILRFTSLAVKVRESGKVSYSDLQD